MTCFLAEGQTQSRRGDWDRNGGPPKRVRREPLTLSAVGTAVVIGGLAGTAAGGLTSFVMSNSQQSKINQEIVNLGKRIGELSKSDQNQWSSQHSINMEFLTDRDDYVHQIEEALCSDSSTHTQNERVLERNNLKIQYHNALSTVISAITTRRITPVIIPISSLRKSLNTNGSLFKTDILAAYSLGQIHHTIYRLNESLVFHVILPTPIPKLYTLYKPFVLPQTEHDGVWKQKYLPDDCRLVLLQNTSRLISIAGWTKEYDLLILETESLNKTKVLTTESTISAPEHAHVPINTVYGSWKVCKSKFELYRWNSEYICNGKNYSTAKHPSQILLSPDIENSLLSSMKEYKRNSGDDKIRRLVESQEQAFSNRSKLVDAYMAQLESLVEATKEGSNLLNGFFNYILKLLPTNWANLIKTFLLVAGVVVVVPIVFLLLLITCKCLSLL